MTTCLEKTALLYCVYCACLSWTFISLSELLSVFGFEGRIPDHCLFTLCTRRSVTLGCTTSQRPALFSLTWLSRSITHRNMDMTRKHINFTFYPRDVYFSSFHIGFSFVRTAVECVILETASGFEPSPKTTAPNVMLYFCLLTLSLWIPLALFIISVDLWALISILYPVQILLRLLTRVLVPAFLQQQHQLHWHTAD